jgi:ADP-ribose pyrophosphatase YjhB (NUDIX family)
VTPQIPDAAAALRSGLTRRSAATVDEDGAQRAAVAVVITSETDPALLLVKRRERTGDPWSGHAALPGGFASRNDAGLSATAERETEEETGLALARLGEQVGRLDDVYPRSVFLPKVIVSPFVYLVPGRPAVAPSEEIALAVWVPLAHVLDAGSRKPFILERGGERLEFEAIHVGGLVVWGLTERILSQLAQVLGSPKAG